MGSDDHVNRISYVPFNIVCNVICTKVLAPVLISVPFRLSNIAYSRTCQTRIRTLISNQMGTLYYAEVFTLVRIWIQIPTQMVSRMVTVPILEMDVHPKDKWIRV